MAKNKKADNQVSAVRRAKHGWVLTVFFSILAVLWLYPIFLVAMNSLKKKGFITRYPFALPDHRSFFGIENFIKGVQKTNFFAAMGNSVIITVGSVFHDRAVPDGYVLPVKAGEHDAFKQSHRYYSGIPRIRSRTGGVYVLRFCEEHSA